MKKFICTMVVCACAATLGAQPNVLQSGPMVGYATMREVQVWVQTLRAAEVQVAYWPKENADPNAKQYSLSVGTKAHNAFTAKITLTGLEPGTQYTYELRVDGAVVERPYPLAFQTQPLWQWRGDPPEITFATGSCAYINDTPYDRPGKPYGRAYEIFGQIHRENPDFMLWLGDNTYLREVDWNSRSGIYYRYTHTRSTNALQPLLGNVHHYAIWDDHDFGPNNSDRGFWNKAWTYEAFNHFWCNPNTDLTGQGGITGTFVWGDLQFFLLDNRYHRSPINAEKRQIIGQAQLDWLVDGLLSSPASFKFVAIGGQVLNTAAVAENYAQFEQERAALLGRIKQHQIKNVFFLTGDRHHTELSKRSAKGKPTVYDLTVSPLTSGVHDPKNEFNALRLPGTLVVDNNFALLRVTGPKDTRQLSIVVKSAKGKVLWEKKLAMEE